MIFKIIYLNSPYPVSVGIELPFYGNVSVIWILGMEVDPTQTWTVYFHTGGIWFFLIDVKDCGRCSLYISVDKYRYEYPTFSGLLLYLELVPVVVNEWLLLSVLQHYVGSPMNAKGVKGNMFICGVIGKIIIFIYV